MSNYKSIVTNFMKKKNTDKSEVTTKVLLLIQWKNTEKRTKRLTGALM